MIRYLRPWICILLLAAVAFAQEPLEEGPPVKDMVHVPGGEIRIIADQRETQVMVASFSMDRTEVTVKEFKQCVNKGVCRSYRKTTTPNLDSPQLPVVDVSPYDAQTYCKWRGKRLPTEAEWKVAAGGLDPTHLYPWGSASPYGRANYVMTGIMKIEGSAYRFANPPCTHPLGSTPSGICDLGGNVAEWVVSSAPLKTATGQEAFTIVGGSYLSEDADLRIDRKIDGQHGLARYLYVGFRCVKDPS